MNEMDDLERMLDAALEKINSGGENVEDTEKNSVYEEEKLTLHVHSETAVSEFPTKKNDGSGDRLKESSDRTVKENSDGIVKENSDRTVKESEDRAVREDSDRTEEGIPGGAVPKEMPHSDAAGESGKVRVIGVRFRTAGKVYYFNPGDLPVKKGSYVIVETVRGVEYGKVAGFPMEIDAGRVKEPLREVIRLATPEDIQREKLNREKEKEAYTICQQKIREHGLDMKLIDAEYTFDNSKVLFYFTADGRVDFRDLVKDLAGIFRMRIELRQIGVRDETKILGGYGICGRPLCCHTWLSEFVPVSIKMAKEQNLSLNPGKISGVCGRLMCCLKNEADTYEELNRNLPRVGDEVQGNDGLSGLVESVNVLRQTVRILVEVDDEKEYHEYEVGDITVLRRRRRGARSRKESGSIARTHDAGRGEKQVQAGAEDKSGGGRNRADAGDKTGGNRNRPDAGDKSGSGRNRMSAGDKTGAGQSRSAAGRRQTDAREKSRGRRDRKDKNRGEQNKA